MNPWEMNWSGKQGGTPTQAANALMQDADAPSQKMPWEETYSPPAQAVAPAQSQSGGYFNDIGNIYQNTKSAVGGEIDAGRAGQQTSLQSGLWGTGHIAGGINQAVGRTIQQIPGYDSFAGGAQKVADFLDQSPQFRGMANAGVSAENAASDWAQNHPATAKSVDALANIGMAAPMVGGVVKPVVNRVAQLGEGSGVSTNAALGGVPKALGLQGSPPIKSAAEIRSAASKSYADADAQGGSLKPEITNSFVDKTESILPQQERVKALVGETASTKLIDGLQKWRDTPMTLAETQELDSHIGDLMQKEVDPKTGKLNAEGNNLLQIQQSLRDTWGNAGEGDTIGGKAGFDAAKNGRDLWAASARMNDIERITQNASNANNPVQATKQGFRSLANNPARLRGFTPEEVNAIQHASKTGIVTNVLRIAGSRLNPIIGGATGGWGGAALGYGVSEIAGRMADARQAARGNAVGQLISNRPAVQKAFDSNGGADWTLKRGTK